MEVGVPLLPAFVAIIFSNTYLWGGFGKKKERQPQLKQKYALDYLVYSLKDIHNWHFESPVLDWEELTSIISCHPRTTKKIQIT